MIPLIIKFSEKFFENPDNIIIFLIFCFIVYAFLFYLFTSPPEEFTKLDLKRFTFLNFYKNKFGPK